MRHLRNLVFLLLVFLGGARRSIRIDDSHHGAQQQNNTVANHFDGSALAQEALIPKAYVPGAFRRAGSRAHALPDLSKQVGQRDGHPESRRALPWYHFGTRRAKVVLQAAGSPEPEQLPSKEAPFAVEAALIRRSVPLVAAVSPLEAAAALRANGVCRVDGVLDGEMCSVLKQHISVLRDRAARAEQRVRITDNAEETRSWNVWLGAVDNRFVPGTRVQLGDPIEKRITRERADVLLPLEDGIVADALRSAASALQAVLCDGAASLPRAHDGVSGDSDPAERALQPEELEIVECGSLIASTGARHQALHADYRRDNVLITGAPGGRGRSAAEVTNGEASDVKAAKPPMPPRLVTFVYLQDTPTPAHGPTVFLPGTARAAAHAAVLRADGTPVDGSLESARVEMATVRAGDAVIYDASVLHYGSANSVPGNERAVFYFGIARKGHALLGVQPLRVPAGLEAADPVRFWDYV